MALEDITEEAVRKAVEEFERLGESDFFERYGFGRSTKFTLIYGKKEKEYPSKAIVYVAHDFFVPGVEPFRKVSRNGGKKTVLPVLERLKLKWREGPPSESQPAVPFDGPDETESAIEGTKTEGRCFKTKRSRRLRNEAFKQSKGICCVCRIDFSKLLDGRGVRVLQVHHREQLSSLDQPRVNTIEDLAVVCANCHMLLHLDSKKALSVPDLRIMLKKDRLG